MAKQFSKQVKKGFAKSAKKPTESDAKPQLKRLSDSDSNSPVKKARVEKPDVEADVDLGCNDSTPPAVDLAAERSVALAALEAVAFNAEREIQVVKGCVSITESVVATSIDTKKPLPKHLLKQQQLLASSNWLALKKDIVKSGGGKKPRRPRTDGDDAAPPAKGPGSLSMDCSATTVVAIDCEMVGVGPGGRRSALARVCLVNNNGNVLLDLFAKPDEPITDYRTWVSGVRPQDLRNASPIWEVIDKVQKLLAGRVIVGHALQNDFRALKLDSHPPELIRDTSKFPKLMRKQGNGRLVPHSLKELSVLHLGIQIQSGEHTPVDDARCALYLYHKFRKEWDSAVKNGSFEKMVAKEKQKALLEAGVLAPSKKKKVAVAAAAVAAGMAGGGRNDSLLSLRRAAVMSMPTPDAVCAGNRNIFTAVEEDERRKRLAAQRKKPAPEGGGSRGKGKAASADGVGASSIFKAGRDGLLPKVKKAKQQKKAMNSKGRRRDGAPLPLFDAKGRKIPSSMLGDVSMDPFADL